MIRSETPTYRFAPSPTGYLHLGHAYSALFSWQKTLTESARFLLRIEDIDTTRCRKIFEQALYEDLSWLGLEWEQPVRRQSEHLPEYQSALDKLTQRGLIYPCFCTRKDIAEEIGQSGNAPHGPDGVIYPGICKHLTRSEQKDRQDSGASYALRLHMDRALAQSGTLYWEDLAAGEIRATPEIFGDVVLARKDIATSYHLSVTLDDALQGITCVTRGMDLFHATHIHRLLQALFDLPVPRWHHHELVRDDQGIRLAKRHNALAIRSLREEGKTPEDILNMIGL
ncbi:tRNA glutamyl-Q(34) synthetase GluQRS [Kiloniella laminariae]|uniref:tRNA glutamyl-Q(34) synthetase GluQRS n=1 Tax=Kiloniella laminariae TaxID=454162 RepID=A0ABT4LKL7_9PROT|nr:tRNA glutamyl-Q(34) synthetase GluQRS [Kiloniella laminariae]MCZ4281662.1 tRNA glutamyl-Q(34) synthetase GluQRS [Kiloniella laminariae]